MANIRHNLVTQSEDAVAYASDYIGLMDAAVCVIIVNQKKEETNFLNNFGIFNKNQFIFDLSSEDCAVF